MPATERSTLRVEGADDAHAIKHLLRRHGCRCPVKGDPAKADWSKNAPTITAVGDDISLLEGMSPAVRFSAGRPVAFVLDADQQAGDRWDEFKRVFECG